MTYAHDAALSTSHAPTQSYDLDAMDDTTAAARAEVIQRLEQLDEQRKEERQRKKRIEEDARNPNESTEAFLAKFTESVTEVQEMVKRVSGSPEEVKGKCEVVLGRLRELDSDISQAAFYLPPFDVRQSRATIAELKTKVEEVRTALAPKKKFAFSKRAHKGSLPKTTATPKAPLDEPSPSLNCTQKSLEGKVGEDVRLTEEDVGSRGFVVEHCTECHIRLEGTLLALQLRDLKRCTVVVVGHVKGATMMFQMEDCHIYIASAQVRIHDSQRTSLFLRVRSNPIIEHSTEMQFGPLIAPIPQLSSDAISALERARDALCDENGLWGAVNDFNWLKETPSPNWSLPLTDCAMLM